MISVENETKNVVEELMNDSDMFTAYDVTKILRDRNPKEKIFHSSVKKKVNALFDNDEMGLYNRELVDIGLGVAPFVYHLPSMDASDYDPEWIEDFLENSTCNPISNVPVASVNAPAQSISTPASIPNLSTMTEYEDVSLSHDNRLNIPKKFIDSFNKKAYVLYDCVASQGNNIPAILLSDNVQNLQSYATVYFKGAYNRVRISNSFLTGSNNSGVYRVYKYSDNKLYVVPVN